MSLDALVCPPGAFPATPLGSADLNRCNRSMPAQFCLFALIISKQLIFAVVIKQVYQKSESVRLILDGDTYTMLYNVLNFPAGVVRMTKVTQSDYDLMEDYPEYDMRHKKVQKV